MDVGTYLPWDVAARELFHIFDCRSFDDWMADNQERELWLRSPDVSKYLCDELAVAHFSVNEFARLLALLTFDADLRSVLIKSGLQRTRYQLDRNIGRRRVWVTKVEPVFNSNDVQPYFDFRWLLSGIDPKLPPLRYREG